MTLHPFVVSTGENRRSGGRSRFSRTIYMPIYSTDAINALIPTSSGFHFSAMEDALSPDGFPPATTIVERHAFGLLAETFLFALYIVFVAYLVCRPWLTRKANALPTFMLPFVLSMFALLTVDWILDIFLLWAKYHILHTPELEGFDGPDAHASSVNEVGLTQQYFAPVYVQYVIQLILIMLGDIISLWRAYVLYGRPRWMYISILCIVAAESVFNVLVFVAFSMEYLSSSTRAVVALASIRTPLNFIAYSIVGVAQIGSTGVIAYKAWTHWKEVREFLGPSTAARRTITTLAVIIETGMAYLGLLLWYAIITWWRAPHLAVVYTCRFYSVPLIAMYPTLVVIIVASRRSVLEHGTESTTHVEEIRFTPADKRGCIRCAHCAACAARSWSEHDDPEVPNDTRLVGFGSGRSAEVMDIVPTAKDDDIDMSHGHEVRHLPKRRRSLTDGSEAVITPAYLPDVLTQTV